MRDTFTLFWYHFRNIAYRTAERFLIIIPMNLIIPKTFRTENGITENSPMYSFDFTKSLHMEIFNWVSWAHQRIAVIQGIVALDDNIRGLLIENQKTKLLGFERGRNIRTYRIFRNIEGTLRHDLPNSPWITELEFLGRFQVTGVTDGRRSPAIRCVWLTGKYASRAFDLNRPTSFAELYRTPADEAIPGFVFKPSIIPELITGVIALIAGMGKILDMIEIFKGFVAK